MSTRQGATRAARSDTPSGVLSLGEIGLQRFAPYLMNRIMGRYNASLKDELAAAGMTTAQMRTLGTLTVKNGISISELCVHAVQEQSTMSRTLDKIEADGLIRRVEDESDSRARLVYITDAGRAVFDAAWPAVKRAEEAFFAGIDAEERERFILTLQMVLHNIRRHPV